MKKTILLIVSLSLSAFLCAKAAGPANNGPVNRDRWLEVDLYWFNKSDMKTSAGMFWNRMSPLFADVAGEKGVILNIGWLMDFILEWDGSLDSPVPFPKGMTIWPMFNDEGYLPGNTAQRMKQAESRFSSARKSETVEYEKWTYGDLKQFIALFKQAAAEHGIKDIHVGTLVLGWKSIYHGNESKFAAKHPDAFIDNRQYNKPFNPTAVLNNDKTRYGAFPGGIPDGLPITKFFGAQWGDLSKKTGLDAIVLRDSVIGPGIYQRTGPNGNTAFADPATVKKWCDAAADLVRATKQANPKALVIGYSNGGAAVGDWRVNCFDLESIAKEGFLDAYIDQSWAGAWNEVAQRPGRFWNSPHMGWTYQLAYILLHGAILSKTPARHYILTETFDAWESWNIIHCARERLRWGIWAYSHAAVKTPGGLKFPDGSYISWCNQVKRLLDEEDVTFLAAETNAAFRDVENIREINGPTLVYSRSAMEWQNANQPAVWMKEWLDDQAGSMMKFSAPILSSARLEDIEHVDSDMFIVQTPIHLKAAEKQSLEKVMASGKPVMICGSPANGIDPGILRAAGLRTSDKSPGPEKGAGVVNDINGTLAENCPHVFPLYHPYANSSLIKDANVEVIYSVSSSPALIRKGSLSVWDAPELFIYSSMRERRDNISTDILLGSAAPYALAARLVNDDLSKAGKFSARSPDMLLPVWCGSWTNKSGELTILLADIEEGLDHAGKDLPLIEMHLPSANGNRFIMREKWSANTCIVPDGLIRYTLRRGESRLLEIKPLKQAD